MANSSGGYDYQFVDEPPQEILICKICLLASRDPYLSVCCGHVFCKSCIDKAKQNTAIVKACPVCRNQEFTTVVNKQVDRLVRSLHIFCTNKGKGCNWQGELNDIDNHLHSGDGCQFEDILCTNECGKVIQRCNLKSHLDSDCPHHKTNCLHCHAKIVHKLYNKHKKECPKFPLPCPNKCRVGNIPRENLQKHLGNECMLQNVRCSNKCGVALQRQFLTYHLKSVCPCRKVTCQYCHVQNTYKFIEGQHKNVCPRFPVFCSNRCGATILRKYADEHKKICPLERVCCTYHGFGCDDVFIRMNQKRHNEESVEKHLQLVASELSNTKQKLNITDQMLSEATGKLVDIQMELSNTRKDLTHAKREKAEIKRTLAYTQMELNSTKEELTAIERGLTRNQRLFTTGINERQSTVEKGLVDIKVDLTNTSYRVNALEIMSYHITKFVKYFTFSSNKIVTAAKWSVYLSAMIKLSKSGNQTCPVYIKKDKFTRLKEHREVWYSNPFYLHDGCKVRLCINATNDHGLFLQLHFMEDTVRIIPLQGILKVLLINPDVDAEDKNLVFENISIRGHKIISTTPLPIFTQPDPYCIDDSVIISVSFSRSLPAEIGFGIVLIILLLPVIFVTVIQLIVKKE